MGHDSKAIIAQNGSVQECLPGKLIAGFVIAGFW